MASAQLQATRTKGTEQTSAMVGNHTEAPLHTAVLLHYHMKFQVNPRVNLEASCCALFCYEYLLALHGRDAFLSVMLWHTTGPQAAGQLCSCTLALSSAAPLPHEVPGEHKGEPGGFMLCIVLL